MDTSLYFKSNRFSNNKALADYILTELKNRNFVTGEPIDSDYMFVIPVHIQSSIVDIYLGKNDEETDVPLWQIWPEIRASFLKKRFSKVDKSPEILLANEMKSIVTNINGVRDIRWCM